VKLRLLHVLAILIRVSLFVEAPKHAQEAQQSPLTLHQAVSIAREKNPARKATLADTRAASSEVKLARSGLKLRRRHWYDRRTQSSPDRRNFLISLALGHWVNPYWYLFTAFVGLNLLQSGFTNWCPMMTFLRKLGVGKEGETKHA